MTRATKRLFFALWPTDAARAALVAASQPALRVCGGRAVPAHQYHVTLAFLGDQPGQSVDRLATLASVEPPGFELVVDRFGHWRRSGILWIGPRECPAGLAVLVAQIRAELDALGISYDGRDFRPHVTLARKVSAVPELDAPAPVRWPVRAFVLVESVTAPGGPIYEVVRRYSPGSGSRGSIRGSYPGVHFPGGSRHDPKQD